MNKLLIVTSFCLSLVLPIFAQMPTASPNPDLPNAPFIARAPDYSSWKVDISSRKDNEPAPTPVLPGGSRAKAPPVSTQKLLKTSVIVKTGDMIREQRTYTDGTNSELWLMQGMILQQNPETGFISVVNPGIDSSAPQFSSSDFTALGWVDLSHFAGSESKRGVKCFIYQWKESLPSPEEIQKLGSLIARSGIFEKFRGKPTKPTRAWIEKTSRLPVAAEDENATYTYTYLTPPTEPLKLPSEFQKVWDKHLEIVNDWKKNVMPKQR